MCEGARVRGKYDSDVGKRDQVALATAPQHNFHQPPRTPFNFEDEAFPSQKLGNPRHRKDRKTGRPKLPLSRTRSIRRDTDFDPCSVKHARDGGVSTHRQRRCHLHDTAPHDRVLRAATTSCVATRTANRARCVDVFSYSHWSWFGISGLGIVDDTSVWVRIAISSGSMSRSYPFRPRNHLATSLLGRERASHLTSASVHACAPAGEAGSEPFAYVVRVQRIFGRVSRGWAGTGREGFDDGSLKHATLATPRLRHFSHSHSEIQ